MVGPKGDGSVSFQKHDAWGQCLARRMRLMPRADCSCLCRAERTLYQNFHDLVRMAFDYGTRTRLFRENEDSGHPYHQPTKRVVAEKNARREGKAIAEQGRVQSCPREEYCGMSLEVWNVLHHGDALLGQRVTRLQGKFFCDCHDFVERAFQCRHACAVAYREAETALPASNSQGIESTLHWALSSGFSMKRRGAPRTIQRRHLAEGARVLVKRNDIEFQIGVITGNTRESCDVKLGENDAHRRVPARSIVDWLSPGKPGKSKDAAAALGTIVPLSKVKAAQPTQRKRKRTSMSQFDKTQDAAAPGLDGHGDVSPKPVPWGLTMSNVNVGNTCPYDAVFVILMHLAASSASIQGFVQVHKERDPQLQQLYHIYKQFWNDSVGEVGTS